MMSKTHDAPKEPGYYWVQMCALPNEWGVAQVLSVEGDGRLCLTCSDHIWTFPEVRWWWDMKILKPSA